MIDLDSLPKNPKKVDDTTYKILQDQGRLPAGWPFRPELVHCPDFAHTANTGTVQTMSTEQLEAELKRRQAEPADTPEIADAGGIVEEEEDDDAGAYDNWTNDQLRAELADRDLSVSGKQAELIKRLEADDAGESDD